MNKTSTSTQEILYYSGGNDVMITGSKFKVKNNLYQLSGISEHSLLIISPARSPFVALMIMSVIIFSCGAFNLLPSANFIVMISGIVLFAAGLVGAVMAKEKYAVKIVTEAGEKKAIVSDNHEYISQIVSALNRANFDMKLAAKK
jgi:hypothetical protein